MKKLLMAGMLVSLLGSIGRAGARVDVVANETALAYDTSYVYDADAVDAKSVSFQAIYTSATVPSTSFTGGTASTGSLTVVSTQGIVGLYGSKAVTVASNLIPENATITIDGYALGGGCWRTGVTSSNTAVSIKDCVNSRSSLLKVTASTTAATVVTLTCSTVGTGCNSKTFAVDTGSLTFSGSTFSGGQQPAVVTIASKYLTEGVDFSCTGNINTTQCAKAIRDAILANTDLTAIVNSTHTANVIFSTSVTNGVYAYDLVSSTPAALSRSGSVFAGGTAPAYSVGSAVITKASHGLSTGLGVYVSTSTNYVVAPLVWGTTYYAIKVDANSFKLATSKANSTAGTAITLTSSRTVTTADTLTLTPSTISGTPSFKWQVSNDGSFWVDMSTRTNSTGVVVEAVSMPSYTFGGATSVWDFGALAYRYVRALVTAPTLGGIYFKVLANSRN